MDDYDERLAKDLYKAGELSVPATVGIPTARRLLSRVVRRPVGNSRRLWMRVAGEDPFIRMKPPPEIKRKTVYADGRFVRLEDGKVPKRGSGPKKVAPPRQDSNIPKGFRDIPTAKPSGASLIPPGFRDIPTASAPQASKNLGDSLIPPGFRDVPTAKSQRQAPLSNPSPSGRGENLGEALIPKGFLDVPIAKPKPPPRGPKPDVMPKAPPLPPREVKDTRGRIRQPRRARQVIRQPISAPNETPREAPRPPSAPTTPEPRAERPSPVAPPAEAPTGRPQPPVPLEPPPKPEAKPGPPPAGPMGDMFSAPPEGRKRIGRRRRPAPTVEEKKTDE